jgi:hypothetical protein
MGGEAASTGRPEQLRSSFVSLGILSSLAQLLSIAGAITFITAQGWELNAILGTKPAWGVGIAATAFQETCEPCSAAGRSAGTLRPPGVLSTM